MEKLKVVISKACPMAGVDFSGSEDLIQGALEEGHSVVIISYLHGKVEKEMGYDIGACLNGEVCADLEKSEYKPGEYEVEVIGYSGGLCKAYLWNSGDSSRGIIVDPECKEDLEYAKEKYNKKAWSL